MQGRVDTADYSGSGSAGAGFAAVPRQTRPLAGFPHGESCYDMLWSEARFSLLNTELAEQPQCVTCQWHAELQPLLASLLMEYDPVAKLRHIRYLLDWNSDPPACETLVSWAADPDFPWLPQREDPAPLQLQPQLLMFLCLVLYLL